MMFRARHALLTDDVTTLWPEVRGQALNREQVFVVVDDAEALCAGLLMFHGGHSLAYAGSVVFVATEHQGRIAHTLMAFVKNWCREQGVTRLGHGAGTPACCQTFLKLGAKITRYHTFMELSIEPHAA